MKSIFVIAHRYHTGLAVRASDVPARAWPARSAFPDARFLELGWGERDYYITEHPGSGLALHALFIPSPSTVEAIGITEPLAYARPDSEIVEVRVPQAQFSRMLVFVRMTFQLDAHGHGTIIAQAPNERGIFYASPRTFDALDNCNVWVALALAAAGLPVHPHTAFTTGLLLHQVRPLSAAPPAAPSR